jgi:hypothetical protein
VVNLIFRKISKMVKMKQNFLWQFFPNSGNLIITFPPIKKGNNKCHLNCPIIFLMNGGGNLLRWGMFENSIKKSSFLWEFRNFLINSPHWFICGEILKNCGEFRDFWMAPKQDMKIVVKLAKIMKIGNFFL